MKLDIIIDYKITIHASLGALALMAGMVALMARKGSRYHKKAGKIFLYAMLFSAVLAMIIALMPGHENAFLFSIGIFSTIFC
ncbi:MAG: hypothetical protein IPN29_03380 [Saprospiraceae bacterium]|nr:hypothetical protein [Saprospiraceae bacterium]